MLPAILSLLLLALSGAALGAAGPGACTNAGCARTADTDGDGRLDWASVGSGGEAYGANLVWRGEGELWYEAIVNTDDHEESYYALWSSGHAHYGGDHRHADVGVTLGEVHGPTGEAHDWWWLFVGVEVPEHLPHLP